MRSRRFARKTGWHQDAVRMIINLRKWQRCETFECGQHVRGTTAIERLKVFCDRQGPLVGHSVCSEKSRCEVFQNNDFKSEEDSKSFQDLAMLFKLSRGSQTIYSMPLKAYNLQRILIQDEQ